MLRGIHLIRHGQSFSNIGYPLIKNSPLTGKGKEQASDLNFEINTIICSPMKRTIDTIKYSKISYEKLFVYNMIRELICEPGDCFDFEKFELEDVKNFNDRMRIFANKLYFLSLRTSSIGIITHGCVIKALVDKQVGNCELHKLENDQLIKIISGEIQLPTNYHEMTEW